VRVRISARARREADRRDAWWRANRLEARNLFTRELLEVIDLLQANTEIGQRYEAARFPAPVRRVLLPKSETHVYFAVVDEDVWVLAVWGARRGRGPKLQR
jgi:plasmid stabilization system protein ParE